MKIIFIIGLQGVGKSRFIADTFGPEQLVIDFEKYYATAEDAGLDKYEASTAVKLMALDNMISMMAAKYDPIVVEFCAMSKMGQATLWAMIESARLSGYKTEIIYLKPKNYMAFKRTLKGNEMAESMLKDFGSGHPRWREPSECPYLDVKTFVIDHSTWAVVEEEEEAEEETWTIEYGTM